MLIRTKDNAVEIVKEIPLMNNGEVIRDRMKAVNIIKAFKPYLITLLEHRREACAKLLSAHINDIFYNDGFTIAWHRKDGTVGYFCIHNYDAMGYAIRLIKEGDIDTFMSSTPMIDQTIKAIMNEPNLDHGDSGLYKFSELVSVLCELHFMPEPDIPEQ